MSEIVLFNFESHDIRYVGDGVEHEWVAADVCEALNLSDPSKALTRLEEDEKGKSLVRTLGGDQELLTINEPGLYELVFGSRKPEAKRFKRWLKHEVLPTIRKKGFYAVSKSDSNQVVDVQAVEVPQLSAAPPIPEIVDDSKALGELFGAPYAESFAIINIKRFHPHKVLPDVAAKNRSSMESSQTLMTPTNIGKELGIVFKTGRGNAIKVNQLLQELGYQTKVEADPPWTPTEKGESFCDRKPISTGSKSDKFQLLWKASIIGELQNQQGSVAA